eukprot:359747-Pleurochrysis_carterae.AAC.1
MLCVAQRPSSSNNRSPAQERGCQSETYIALPRTCVHVRQRSPLNVLSGKAAQQLCTSCCSFTEHVKGQRADSLLSDLAQRQNPLPPSD